ncbi:unnamed protein product [Brassica rapa subsp. narinosa]
MVFLGGKSSSSSEKTKSEWVCTSFTTPSYLKSEDKEMYGICIVESMVRCYENLVACF